MRFRFAHPLGVACSLLTLGLLGHALDINTTANATTLLNTNALPGEAVKPGTELRILCAGDSITSGWLSDDDGGNGNGYRLPLRDDLSKDEVVFAGTVSAGNMTDGYFAAWPGKTVKYISDHVGPSLKQRPNIILLHAGTNDMDDRPLRSTEGNEPVAVAERLGDLIDQMIEACPDAVILVAIIIDSCDPHISPRIPEYQAAIPGIVEKRRLAGHHVLAVDFTTFSESDLQDCVHPTVDGYRKFGDYWIRWEPIRHMKIQPGPRFSGRACFSSKS
ncbi:hypothetical protein AK830_g2370 [Neonectria ditissima]|uniref:SGNH hydrolase-type esterase domain-containing protein n=1 Tax=Neonectria ditissima TaxID=78410 RepID=A0A0P7B3D7_9HYPO|nr:hypothetical protein AK830_g2370 [Neonectria ditissima]